MNSPLHDPVTWDGINYAGTQMTQCDFQNKGTRTSPARLSFVLKVPPRNLCPSIIYSVPCDRSYKVPIVLVTLRSLVERYTVPWKIQPITTQESCCMFDGITFNLPIVRCAYVTLIVLAIVFSMAWDKKGRQCSFVVNVRVHT